MLHRILAAAAVSVAVLAAPVAHAAPIEIGQAFGTALQPYIDAAVQALIAALVGWVLILAKNKLNVSIDDSRRDAVVTFLKRQASSLLADGAVKLKGVKIEVDNAALANAANKALDAIPDALKHFNLSPAALQERIVDMLPKEPAVAAAQATAIDVENPATPSKA